MTTVITAIRNAEIVDRYHIIGHSSAAGGLEGRSISAPRRNENRRPPTEEQMPSRSCRPGLQRVSRRTSSTSRR